MCEHERTAFIEGEKVCIDCGLLMGDKMYITSYNRVFSYRRQPIYSRQKRFYHFLISSGNPVIFQNLEDIMTCFGKLEFFWSMKKPKTRKYFFNRFVTLVFILKHLSVNTEGMRTLKDKERVDDQIRVMSEILKNSFL